MNKRIFVDMDEVLVNTHHGLMKWHGIKEDPYDKLENRGTRETHTLMNMSWYECWYKPDHTFWSGLDPMPWAHELIDLCQEFAHNEVYFLTSPVPNGHCSFGKQIWINKHFPKMAKKLIIGHAKWAIVDNSSILLDDSYSNEKRFANEGKQGNFYLFPSLMNNRHAEFEAMFKDKSILLNEVREVLNDKFLQSTCP